jgi:hypothetical protein
VWRGECAGLRQEEPHGGRTVRHGGHLYCACANPHLVHKIRKRGFIVLGSGLYRGRGSETGVQYALQGDNTENSKQIFPEKEFPGLSSIFHIHVSVND